MALRVEENSTLRVNPSGGNSGLAGRSARPENIRREATDGWTVSGRGELHLAILMERMRREGYEFQVARPEVIDKVIDGKTLTPYEKVYIEVPEDLAGTVIQKMGARRADLLDMRNENGISFMEFVISTKGLFGYRSEFITDTRGFGIMNTLFFEYASDNGYTHEREQGSLVAFENGVTTGYGITNTQDRGSLFVGPAVAVYKGQVIGQNSRNGDLSINVCKTKNLTNMRSKGDGVSVHVKEPRKMDLEDALEYISDDELVEITPKSVRIRKIILDEAEARRKKSQGIV